VESGRRVAMRPAIIEIHKEFLVGLPVSDYKSMYSAKQPNDPHSQLKIGYKLISDHGSPWMKMYLNL
jgi:hypothetical protein